MPISSQRTLTEQNRMDKTQLRNFQESTVTVFLYLSCRVPGESSLFSLYFPRPKVNPDMVKQAKSNCRYLLQAILSLKQLKKRRNSTSFSYRVQNDTLCYVAMVTPWVLQAQWCHMGVALSPFSVVGNQTEIVENHLNDPFLPAKRLDSFEYGRFMILKYETNNSLQWHFKFIWN